jgi:hypothetical protein
MHRRRAKPSRWPGAITVTGAANSKIYNGTTDTTATPTITSGTLATGDTANFSEAYLNANIGTGKTLHPSGSVSDGNLGNNHDVTFVDSANGTITKATNLHEHGLLGHL